MKKIKVITAFAFLLFIFSIAIAGVVEKDRTFSENENRYLKEKPDFSLADVMSGKFQKSFEDYMNDQIVLRDFWIEMKTSVEQAMGNHDIGGAYVGKDGYDFEKITPSDVSDTQVKKNTKEIAEYLEYCSNSIGKDHLAFMLLPTAGLVMEEKLPKNAIMFDQNAYMDQIENSLKDYQVIDVRKELTQANQVQTYYRTDHHWTTDGAFVGYQKWCKVMDKTVPQKEDYEVESVTDDFRGSLYSKVLNVNSASDSILRYQKIDGKTDLSVTKDGEAADGIYDLDKLNTKDKYAFFFGGNYGEVSISDKNADTDHGKNLLVIKDSFANCFVPFLTEDFNHIYMIDLRYYTGSMKQYIQEKQITDVLVLYNVSNFISDKDIFKLNKE